MDTIIIRELRLEDKDAFIAAMQRSQALHHPWVKAPQTPQEFSDYFQRYQQSNQKSFLVCDSSENIAGVFNISEIVRGFFQNAYLGFYVVADYDGQGYMSAGLKLVLQKFFNEMKLHRLEANIQPDNMRSINLIRNNGFRKEGYSPRYLKINNEWRDHERWAITLEDFNKNNKIKIIDKLEICALNEIHINEIVSAFKNIGWDKPKSIYETYIKEANQNLRSIFIAKLNGQFCGYVTIKWKSDYQPFSLNDLPEISDLNVLPYFRKKGIGTTLIQKCENIVKERGFTKVGLGVGMTSDYGNAQRLYVQLGYVPDGNGLHYKGKAASYSDTVIVDDDLVLYLHKSFNEYSL